MAIELSDDGTMDTVLVCSECGEQFRYNFDGTGLEGGCEHGCAPEADCGHEYERFVEWAIEDATGDHECPRHANPPKFGSQPAYDDK